MTYTGWGQRPSDFSRSSWGGPPPGPRSLARRLLTWGIALVAFVGVGVVVMLAIADDDQEEIAERSQPPVVHEARLVDDDRLELDVSGPPGADYCLESPAPTDDLPDYPGRLCTSDAMEAHWFSVDDLELDADDLVGEELVVTALSKGTESGGARLATGLLSEPSEPVEIVDAR
jgi:hypothetical protein